MKAQGSRLEARSSEAEEGSGPKAQGSREESGSVAGRVPMIDTDLVVRSRKLANRAWTLAQGWNSFAQITIGKQLVSAVDSVGANLVEGDGRATENDTLRFFAIARGSLREVEYWLIAAHERQLISTADFEEFLNEHRQLVRMLNAFISYRRRASRTSTTREELATYGDPAPEFSFLEPRASSL